MGKHAVCIVYHTGMVYHFYLEDVHNLKDKADFDYLTDKSIAVCNSSSILIYFG